jgi:hypothetical protein
VVCYLEEKKLLEKTHFLNLTIELSLFISWVKSSLRILLIWVNIHSQCSFSWPFPLFHRTCSPFFSFLKHFYWTKCLSITCFFYSIIYRSIYIRQLTNKLDIDSKTVLSVSIFINFFFVFLFCRSIKAFQQLLYVSPDFVRANEVHLRLGLMFKVNGNFEQSLKHLQLALLDSSACTFTKLDSEYIKLFLFYILFIIYE